MHNKLFTKHFNQPPFRPKISKYCLYWTNQAVGPISKHNLKIKFKVKLQYYDERFDIRTMKISKGFGAGKRSKEGGLFLANLFLTLFRIKGLADFNNFCTKSCIFVFCLVPLSLNLSVRREMNTQTIVIYIYKRRIPLKITHSLTDNEISGTSERIAMKLC